MKRIILMIQFLMVSFIFTLIIGNNKIYAAASTNDAGNATWNVTSEKKENLFTGLIYNKAVGTTTSVNNPIGNQSINEFEMKTDGVTSKLVSWAIPRGNYSYTRNGLSYIAQDYEAKHPGWIVVAGINSDQYFDKYGDQITVNGSFYFHPQPYYPLIMDGERRFAYSPLGISTNYVGVTNNYCADVPYLPGTSPTNLYLEIIDNNGDISFKQRVVVNKEPGENETSVWLAYASDKESSIYVTQHVENENGIFYSSKADMAYMSNSRFYNVGARIDTLFAKGAISSIENTCEVNFGQFAIETNQETVREKLQVGSYVKIQYGYDNKLDECEAAFGYHSIQRYNDVDVETNQSYDTRRYNRSIFGRKADGTYVLMTVAKGEFSGTTHDESNAILKYYGVTEAYQQDGGGSVTAILRNEFGQFDIVQESSDSSTQRAIMCGSFFVIRDPGFVSYKKDSTRWSVGLSKNDNFDSEIIKNIVATCDNKTYEITDTNKDMYTFEVSKEDTPYIIDLSYDIYDKKTKKDYYVSSYKIKTHSAAFIPQILDLNYIAKSTEIIIEQKELFNETFSDVLIKINDQTYSLSDTNKRVTFKNLTPNTRYNIEITYKNLDTITNKYYDASNTFEISTKEFDIPEINNFKVSIIDGVSVNVDIDILDVSNVIKDVLLIYKYDVSEDFVIIDELNKSFIISDLNLTKEYKFYLEILYGSNNQKLTSEIIDVKYELKENENNENNEKPKKKCLNKCSTVIEILCLTAFIYIILKKEN